MAIADSSSLEYWGWDCAGCGMHVTSETSDPRDLVLESQDFALHTNRGAGFAIVLHRCAEGKAMAGPNVIERPTMGVMRLTRAYLRRM
jgi:hypothetical protein